MQYDYISRAERNNHKTMRISDAALEFIITFEGNTFNDQVNNMIDYFMNGKQAYDEELKKLDNKINQKKDLLNDFQTKCYSLYKLAVEVNNEIRDLKY